MFSSLDWEQTSVVIAWELCVCLVVGTAQLLPGATRSKGWTEAESTRKWEYIENKIRRGQTERAEIQTLNSKREDYSVSPTFKFLGGQFWLKVVWKKFALILIEFGMLFIQSALNCCGLSLQADKCHTTTHALSPHHKWDEVDKWQKRVK